MTAATVKQEDAVMEEDRGGLGGTFCESSVSTFLFYLIQLCFFIRRQRGNQQQRLRGGK